MTFRKFARKFKQKANEWEMIKESYFRTDRNKFLNVASDFMFLVVSD